MKFVQTFERFTTEDKKVFRFKKPNDLSIGIWNTIARGMRSGIITDYKLDYYNSPPKVTVFYADGTEFILPLKKTTETKYVNNKKYNYVVYRALYGSRDEEKNHPNSTVQFTLKGTRLLKKMKHDTIIGYDNKEHDKSEINDMIKDSPIYQKILRLGNVYNVTNDKEKKNGTVVLGFLATGRNRVIRTSSNGSIKVSSFYKLTIGGRVKSDTDMFVPSFTMPPIKTMQDFDKLLEFVYKKASERINAEITRWKNIIAKDPSREKEIPDYLSHYFWHESAQDNAKISSLLDSGIL